MSAGRGRSANAVGASSIVLALAAALCLCLLWCATASAASAAGGHPNEAKDSRFTSSGIERYSRHPSGEHPYLACPPPTKERASCDAVVVPDGAMKAVRRQRKAQGLTGHGIGTPALEGSGVDGGFSPTDLRSAYKLTEAGGKGSTIAIVIAWNNPTAESDLATYRSHYGLPPCTKANGCFRKVNQKGEEGSYPANGWEVLAEGWELESDLDIEMASAICPECHITLVEADSYYFEDLGPAENTAASLGATVISNSYGGNEFEEETEFDSLYYNHPGVPILFSSGDSAYGTAYPSASPNVISAGGTSLGKDEGARGWREKAWGGAGSGCSPIEKKPEWQTDKGCGNRTITDVSAVADSSTPVSVYAQSWTQEGQTEPGWVRVGGTSVAAPILAGVEARLSGAERAEGAKLFWKKGPEGKLFDVADGRNGRCGLKNDYLCAGRAGYDGPSGWGTPGGARPAPPVVGTYDATNITPSGATLNGAVNPNGESTTYRFEWGPTTEYGNLSPAKEASAGSGTEAVEASTALTGLTDGATYHYRLVATNAKGTTRGYDHSFVGSQWTTQYLYTFDSKLADVSCPASTGCMAAGSYFLPFEVGGAIGNDAPLGERWDGSEWIVQKALPAHESGESYHSEFNGTSCASASECLAVGTKQEAGEGQQPLSERWNGSEWKIVPTPMPADAAKNEFGFYSVELRDVSCPAASLCIAVGDYATKFEGATTVLERKTLVEYWNGTEWQVGASPNPAGQKLSYLSDVSCSSATSCVAVGHQGTYENEFPQDAAARTLVESWNGTTWSVQTSPNATEAGSYLESVSCVSASSCMAVGHAYREEAFYEERGFETHRKGLAERWNGSEWKMASPRRPLSSVSCTGPGFCVGVGHVGGDSFPSFYTARGVAEVWNGSAWISDEPPLPADHYSISEEEENEQQLLGASSWGELTGVSCQSSSICTVVGWYLGPWGKQWISDRLSISIPPPTFSSSFGSSGSGDGQLKGPTGTAVDAAGNLWVVDTNNNRVQ
jgi:hypothetical protein